MADAPSKLNQVDLSKVTLDDLQKLPNVTLRNSLIDMIRNPSSADGTGHQNHGSHTNSGSAMMLDQPELAVKAVTTATPVVAAAAKVTPKAGG